MIRHGTCHRGVDARFVSGGVARLLACLFDCAGAGVIGGSRIDVCLLKAGPDCERAIVFNGPAFSSFSSFFVSAFGSIWYGVTLCVALNGNGEGKVGDGLDWLRSEPAVTLRGITVGTCSSDRGNVDAFRVTYGNRTSHASDRGRSHR